MTPAMRPCRLIVVLSLVLPAAVTGCSQTTVTENPLRVAVTDDAMVRAVATDVLEAMYFDVERPPRSPDRLDTLPLVSAYPAEFWRPDTRTAYDRVETALHTVRRTVVIHLRPDASGPDKGMLIEAVVTKERLSLPEPLDATTVNEAYGVFSSRRTALETYESHWGQGTTWMDYGRDPELEYYILTRIRNRL